MTDKLLKDLKFGVLRYSDPSPQALLAATTMSQLLSVPYKDSDAGSNPREFQGMKSGTNKKILESLIKHHNTTFWALHSGVSITAINARVEEGILQFDDACLTNGLQTVTIGRILTLVKTYQQFTGKSEIHTKINQNMQDKWKDCIKKEFPDDISKQLSSISMQHVNSVLNWLGLPVNETYLDLVNKMTLEDILNTKLSVKVVRLNELADLVAQVDDEPDLETLGNDIAEANNETQKVDPGDLFGTSNQAWLKKELFNKKLDGAVIEYRRGSEDRSKNAARVIHVLDLLRAHLPTTFIVDPIPEGEDLADFVADYANRREPIYNWFSKVIKAHESGNPERINDVVTILRNLTPSLVKMMFRAQSVWDEQRKELSFAVVNEWTPLKKTSLGTLIFEGQKMTKPNEKADAEIKRFLSFSFSNIFTIFVFATRTAIQVADDLNVTYDIDDATVGQMVRSIYKTLAKTRLKSTLGSTSNLFRDPEIYRASADQFKMVSEAKGNQYSDSLAKYRVTLV